MTMGKRSVSIGKPDGTVFQVAVVTPTERGAKVWTDETYEMKPLQLRIFAESLMQVVEHLEAEARKLDS